MRIKINWTEVQCIYCVWGYPTYTYDHEAGWIEKVRALEDKEGFVKVQSEQDGYYFVENGFTICKNWVSEVRDEG